MTEEEEAKNEILNMSREQLGLLDFDKFKLKCYCKGCDKFWNVKDFGIAPMYYIRGKFYDLSEINAVCDYHFKTTKWYNVREEGNSEQRLIKQ